MFAWLSKEQYEDLYGKEETTVNTLQYDPLQDDEEEERAERELDLELVESQIADYKKENAMNSAYAQMNVQADVTDSQKRNHLRGRLADIFYERDYVNEEKFGLIDQDPPKTPKELVDRIKTGTFTFTEPSTADDKEHWQYYGSPIRGIRWRDPSVVKDRDGYGVAKQALVEEKTRLLDSINIKDPEVALTELQEWERA